MKKSYACKRYATALAFAALLGVGASAQAAVRVYAEGAYTATDLVVNIYADIPATDTLVSNGVKLKFNKARLQVPTATDAQKNEAVWFFGDGSVKYPYMNPEVYNDAGEVVVVGGKLKTTNPTEGVSGNRVLLGKVKFKRVDGGAAVNTPEPEDFFGISVEKGKGGTYVNFATTAGASLDDSGLVFSHALSPTNPKKSAFVRARGDADGDKKFSNVDMGTVRNMILAGGSDIVYADADADGKITNADMGKIRNLILGK